MLSPSSDPPGQVNTDVVSEEAGGPLRSTAELERCCPPPAAVTANPCVWRGQGPLFLLADGAERRAASTLSGAAAGKKNARKIRAISRERLGIRSRWLYRMTALASTKGRSFKSQLRSADFDVMHHLAVKSRRPRAARPHRLAGSLAAG